MVTQSAQEGKRPLTRFGFLTTNLSYSVTPADLFSLVLDLADAAEGAGFDTFWVPDHIVQGPVADLTANTGGTERDRVGADGTQSPLFEALTLLGALAARTNRVRIGPLVSPITTRHPALLAKMMTTVDVVSGGRAVLGLGAAWDADEHRRYGFDFPPPGERIDRLEDAVHICRAMFDDAAPSYAGKCFSIEEAVNMPRPISKRIPILIGGSGKRSLQIAATYGDACNPFMSDIATMREHFERVDGYCQSVGRDPNQVARPVGVVFNTLESMYSQVNDAFAAGGDGVILIPWQLALLPADIEAIGKRLVAEYGGEMDISK